jgi:NAD(P)-dependent dehydrogenase (short-subunit alcohol dehydrogenase family)
MAGKLAGKIALVTGGNVGLGQAAALTLAREGAKVVIAARRGPEGHETVQRIHAMGGDAIFVQTDVSQTAQVEAMVQQTVATYGRLDCALNNAGTEGVQAPVVDATEEVWDRVLSINLKGTWLCMKYEIRQMLLQGQGAIVNMASVLGLVATPLNPAYTASKHGVVGLTKSAALAYAQAGIRVNVVCPGYIHSATTERIFAGAPERQAAVIARHPVGRMGYPAEVAEAVVWLCSDAASFVTGHTMVVDGGYVAQ